MVSARPSPAPARGRIPYPSADSYVPGDAGVTPALNSEAGPPSPSAGGSGAAQQAIHTSSSSSAATPAPATPATEESDMGKEGGVGGGLRRLASVRRRSTREKEKEKEKEKERERDKDLQESPEHETSAAPKETREMSEREQNTLGLKTWWKNFTQRDIPPAEKSFRRAPQTMNTRRVFGVSLGRVIDYAGMEISTSAPDGSLYVWGKVPIIVGRCGAYLKDKTDIEGVFRISGSAKRMRDLQVRFDEGPQVSVTADPAALQMMCHMPL